ncbi:MAG: hypothetical protein K0U66_04005, partial [Gammaproteobacteria bacterium]|nr:hypothetical protein [Gammaproteobacteria bacterium]
AQNLKCIRGLLYGLAFCLFLCFLSMYNPNKKLLPMVNAAPPPNSSDGTVRTNQVFVAMNRIIAVALANAAADLKKGNDIFKDEVIRQVKKIKKGNKKFQARTEAFLKEASAEMKEENNVFRKEMRAEMVASRKEYDEKMVASRKEYDEKMVASRKEFREDMAASRKEFRKDMAAFKKVVDGQIKDFKRSMQWLMGVIVLLFISDNFLPLLLAPTENPGVVQVEQTENQHPQTKKELTQVQGQLTQVQDQLTQVIEYLQADARPGQATPALPTTKPGAEQDAR